MFLDSGQKNANIKQQSYQKESSILKAENDDTIIDQKKWKENNKEKSVQR